MSTLADGVTLDAHVMIRGRTTIGARTRVATFAVIGGEAQDLSYKGEDTAVEIGAGLHHARARHHPSRHGARPGYHDDRRSTASS